MRALRSAARPCRKREAGQATIEFAILLPPLLLLLLFGMLEMGSVFDHNITIAAASREGARTAGALVNGGGPLGCANGQSPNRATVDPLVVAAVERVLTSAGAHISLADVTEIRLYKATATGTESAGLVNIWRYTPGAGPLVAGKRLDFSEASAGWPACVRSNLSPADSIGVSLRYAYPARTPFGWIVPGLNVIGMVDRSVMPLSATR